MSKLRLLIIPVSFCVLVLLLPLLLNQLLPNQLLLNQAYGLAKSLDELENQSKVESEYRTQLDNYIISQHNMLFEI